MVVFQKKKTRVFRTVVGVVTCCNNSTACLVWRGYKERSKEETQTTIHQVVQQLPQRPGREGTKKAQVKTFGNVGTKYAVCISVCNGLYFWRCESFCH